MSINDPLDDFFTLFDLNRAFSLDLLALDAAYLDLQKRYHPDRAVHLDDSAQRRHLELATYINAAYQTLKYPVERARYLLKLNDIDTEEETNTIMPMDFLMAQMALREDIVEARATQNVEALESLHQSVQHEIKALEKDLAEKLDLLHEMRDAAQLVRQYRFYEKLDEEINHAIEAIVY